MLNRLVQTLAVLALLSLGACEAPKKTQGAKRILEQPPTVSVTSGSATVSGKTTAAQPAGKEAPKEAATSTSEVVFNPLKPPAGYVNCHNNHCHVKGGGVESYKQVMEKMGATKIIEPPKPKAPADVAGPPGDAIRTASGLAYKVINAGEGDQKPNVNSTVVAHLNSWTTDGKSMQSTTSRGRPATIPLGRVFPGLREAFLLMTVGSEVRFWMPPELAYNGKKGMVVFDIELIGSRDPAAAPTP
jgi:hypothetical protein